MANVIPFKGVLYNTEKIKKIADVVAPPYDVISSDEQQELHDRHKYNIVRLILGKKLPEDNNDNNPHTRAAEYFNKWNKKEVFVRDKKPHLYLESSEFKFNGMTLSRLGLISRVKIEPFEKGIILPHEKTFSKVKSERLGLIKATKMNFSCIFGLYPDRMNIFKKLQNIVDEEIPFLNFINHDGLRHKLWKIESQDFHSLVNNSLKNENIIIADGHHRYETALNYRNYLSKNLNSFDETHPSNYVMMYLSSMNDPGLIIKPTHRMLKNFNFENLEKFMKLASEYFEISFHLKPYNEVLETIKSINKNAFVLFTNSSEKVFKFILKDGVMNKIFQKEIQKSLRELDVTVLTQLVFMHLMGLDQNNMDDTSSFGYVSDTDEAFRKVKSGEYEAAFILNPTKIDEVKKVAEASLIMPRKSTFFYPKVVSGLVQNVIG